LSPLSVEEEAETGRRENFSPHRDLDPLTWVASEHSVPGRAAAPPNEARQRTVRPPRSAAQSKAGEVLSDE